MATLFGCAREFFQSGAALPRPGSFRCLRSVRSDALGCGGAALGTRAVVVDRVLAERVAAQPEVNPFDHSLDAGMSLGDPERQLLAGLAFAISQGGI